MSISIALHKTIVERKQRVRPNRIARFTLDGGGELENHLASVCGKLLTGVQKIIPSRKLEGLLLGGGYGRGEGGVMKTESGDRPYNDLEYYVFIHGNDWLNKKFYDAALRDLTHELKPEAGVEVEFKIISANQLRRSPPSMFYYDLVMGHHRLWGGENLLAGCEYHCDVKDIPLFEATRLMMNRCSGLLFAREKLKGKSLTSDDADFVARNLAKAQLAFGDALLTAFGQYHWSCLERRERLRQLSAPETLPWFDEARRYHSAGVEFKLHPRRTLASRELFEIQHRKVTSCALQIWLWLESRRLGCNFRSARDYALNPLDKCPGTNPWRNRLLNAKVFGLAAFFQTCSHRHPREKILDALALLLWDSESPGCSRAQFNHSAANPVNLYQKMWRRCS